MTAGMLDMVKGIEDDDTEGIDMTNDKI